MIKNLKTNESVTVTAGGTGEGGPSFSPDGDKILFVSSKNGVGRQAFVYEIKSKSITPVSYTHLFKAFSRKHLFVLLRKKIPHNKYGNTENAVLLCGEK